MSKRPMPKIDAYTRRALEQNFRKDQEARFKAESEKMGATLLAMALRLAHAEFDDAQVDMPVLAKYGHASKIKVINLRVQNPADDKESYYYREAFGLETDADGLWVPTGHSGYVDLHLNNDDADWATAWAAVEWRRSFQQRMASERAEFAAFIRSTTSWAKLSEHPIVADSLKNYWGIAEEFNVTPGSHALTLSHALDLTA